jgi:hypothetical protein
MTNVEWIDMLRVVPEDDQNQMVIVLQNGAEITVDTLFGFEPNFLVMRGRVGGTTDEGRAFFIPYDQMLYCRIERVTNIAEIRDFMQGKSKAAAPVSSEPIIHTAPAPIAVAPVPPVTDATANRNALLDRIRAARVTQAATRRQASQ